MKASWGRAGLVDRRPSKYIKTFNLELLRVPLISFFSSVNINCVYLSQRIERKI